MVPFTTKALEVTEKLCASATLYQPSKHLGDGWAEMSASRRGGKAIIQIQKNEVGGRGGRKSIAVFQYQLGHGQDIFNAQIIGGRPIYQKEDVASMFKSLSTSTNAGICTRKITINIF